jgi:hypothetical protein
VNQFPTLFARYNKREAARYAGAVVIDSMISIRYPCFASINTSSVGKWTGYVKTAMPFSKRIPGRRVDAGDEYGNDSLKVVRCARFEDPKRL